MKKYIKGGFWFDEESHTYGHDEIGKLGGFTEVFRELGLMKTAFYTDEGRDRGSALHLLTAAHDSGKVVDEAKIEDKRLLGRFRAWLRFRAETGFLPIPLHIEQPLYNAELEIACTIDRAGYVPGVHGLALLDIKGGAKAGWHGRQTAWQSLCLHGPKFYDYPRFAVYLKDNGRYKLERHEDREDFEVAEAAAIIQREQRRIK